MGVNNRQRRRANKQKRQRQDRPVGAGRAASPGPTRGGGDGRWSGSGQPPPPDDQIVRDTVLAAAQAGRSGRDDLFRDALQDLAAIESVVGRAPVDAAVRSCVERGLNQAWASGWQPADVMRALRRALGPVPAGSVAEAVAESGARRPEAAADDRWAAQVGAIADDAGCRGAPPAWVPPSDRAPVVEAISVLLTLPPLPSLGAPRQNRAPAGRRRSGASSMLERVRALLAKAESTTFPEEAESLTAKAQELMARHAIDEAMLGPGDGTGTTDVAGWRIGVDDPYAHPKSLLLHSIAAANRCRAVWCTDVGFSTVFGARSDLEMVEVLFTSLLVQGTDAMVRAGPSIDWTGRSRTRSFRQSFLVAYARRIGERLAATTAAVVAQEAERRGEALLPVLASRATDVEEAVHQAFPTLVRRGPTVSNYEGWTAGRAAADLASFGVGDELAAG